VTQTAWDGSDFVKVVDFGIAKVREGAFDVGSGYGATKSGMIVGTPQYLSPEQAMGMQGEQIDGRADIYSLGIVLYMMLTGQLPFDSDTPMGFLMHHVQTLPVAPHIIRPDLKIPVVVSALLMRALEKDRDRRFASAEEMAQALRHLQAQAPTVAQTARAPEAPTAFDSPTEDVVQRPVPKAPMSAPPVRPPEPVRAPEPPRAPEPLRMPEPVPAPALPRAPESRPQGSDAPLGSRPLQAPIGGSPRTAGLRPAVWVTAGVVGLGAVVLAVLYFTGALSGTGSRPNAPSQSVESGPSQAPAQHTDTTQAAPSGSSEANAAKPSMEDVPSSKPAKPAQETVSSAGRPEKKKTQPVKGNEAPSTELPEKPPGPDVEGLIAAGKQAADNGEYTTAIANYQRALRADPSNAKALAGLEGAKRAKQTEDQVLKPH